MAFPIDDGSERPARGWPCPACCAELPVDAVPLGSIVLCARCCTALSWDGAYTLLTATQMAGLPVDDRARLEALVAAQRDHLRRIRRAN